MAPVTTPNRRVRLPGWAMAPLFYAACYSAFFSPVLFSGGVLAPGDAGSQNLPTYLSERTLWTTLLFSGFPTGADPQSLTWYPLSVIFSALGMGWNLYLLSAYVLASSFMYGYVVTLTSSRFAGLASGLVYGMSGFFMAHLGHTNMIHAAAWMPLVLWALERLRRGFSARWFVAGALALALVGLAGHPQVFVYALALSAAYVAVLGWPLGRRRWRYYGVSALLALLGVGMTAIVLVPGAELRTESIRSVWTFQDFVAYYLPLEQLPQLLFPYLYGGLPGIPHTGEWGLTETTGYVGLLPLALAGIGLIQNRRTLLAWFWFTVGVMGLLLALGPETSLAELTWRLPGVRLFRVPGRHVLELALAVAVLSGMGLASLQRMPALQRVRNLAYAGGAMIVLATVALAAVSRIPEGPSIAAPSVTSFDLAGVPIDMDVVPVRMPLLAFVAGLAVLLWWSRRPGRLRGGLLLALLIVELGAFGWFYEWRWDSPPAAKMTIPQALVPYRERLEATGERLTPIHGARAFFPPLEAAPPNQSRAWNVPTVGGYNPLILQRYADLLRMPPFGVSDGGNLSPENRTLDILANRYVLVPKLLTDGTPARFKAGFGWGDEDLGVRVGPGCGASPTTVTTLHLPRVPTAEIGLVTSLECSREVPQGAQVGVLTATAPDGRSQSFPIRAGIHTSEWAWDRSDVRPLVAHGKAVVYENFPAPDEALGSFAGHRYLSRFALPAVTDLSALRLTWSGPEGALVVHKVSLKDATGTTYAVPALAGYLQPARWAHVEDLEVTSVYENLRRMPRAWLAGSVLRLKPDEIREAIQTSRLPDGASFDPAATALVEEPVPVAARAGSVGTARVSRLEETFVEVQTRSDSPAFLVLSDAYYPGWQVAVDGRRARLYRTNYVLRGVAVPAGRHTVRFEFRPASVYRGAAISGLSAIVLALVTLAVSRGRLQWMIAGRSPGARGRREGLAGREAAAPASSGREAPGSQGREA